ncbi:protein-L-isoaspartate(D-aspartate) O-methyltransferase [Kangiella sediminilitoris]|uniref:Protein-L-isoaspartate O-methyltransferase n=1 Tax=Kangiella sediminilitoris TaxID=1144748 RepID=A0A1B3BBQ5_9GAMM|nr:protein-L-isoaspartate(D-aspartate) O-methyltransferase [Kangiella sediminilitoris]AOE50224.1 Protein-L-isoaspartate O-methyltransferase [Kangiella sediminilitoris]
MNATHISGIGMTSARTRTRLVERLRAEGIKNEELLKIIELTPRHLFVDEGLSHRAYEDTALPIGMGQTISQPYIVAKMTETLMETGSMNKVLEIGTGCGYQTSILGKVSKTVFTVERIRALHMQARKTLTAIGQHNIQYLLADGFNGWQQYAPYDAIIVTAAPPKVPEKLLAQLADGGRMVIPVGTTETAQDLMLIQRKGDEFEESVIEKVRFVPLVSGIER